MAINSLPRFFALKSDYNNKYLRYLNEKGEVNKLLQFSGEEVLSPYVKFTYEEAKTGNGLFMHLRCCFNNKYWVKSQDNIGYTSASANEPEEDRSNVSCTLFEPLFIDEQTLRFRHVQTGNYACLWKSSAPFTNCIATSYATEDAGKCDVYTIINWDSLTVLPKYIAFKGDNGSYLSLSMVNRRKYLEFLSSSDIDDSGIENTVFTTSNGNVRIKSNIVGKFWRRSWWSSDPNWIMVESDDSTTNDSYSVFQPIKVDNDIFALRNMGNNQFCERVTTGKTSWLSAGATTSSLKTHMQVVELVISRRIYNVDFRLTDARSYSHNAVELAYGSAINKTQESQILGVKLSYTDTKSTTWDSSVSLKQPEVNNKFRSCIPVTADNGKVKLSDEFKEVIEWGKTESSHNIVGTVYQVALPPMTMARVSLLATQGSCDVPFSYTQKDFLINRGYATYDMDDGVFTGFNYFNFKFEIKQESLT